MVIFHSYVSLPWPGGVPLQPAGGCQLRAGRGGGRAAHAAKRPVGQCHGFHGVFMEKHGETMALIWENIETYWKIFECLLDSRSVRAAESSKVKWHHRRALHKRAPA